MEPPDWSASVCGLASGGGTGPKVLSYLCPPSSRLPCTGPEELKADIRG